MAEGYPDNEVKKFFNSHNGYIGPVEFEDLPPMLQRIVLDSSQKAKQARLDGIPTHSWDENDPDGNIPWRDAQTVRFEE